ncbi:nitric oxide synthase oxygenase [Paraliomyxa miuraensis]|uniref:nitric oxide synthase oxygenase n=1 Tax=Paraliomyxa miuraensis TaxID=376150 RepID=UPI0022568D47|nr:nitric oxide synthase oxygenase [Paraliomyxa miuraensis]MCX4240726.1 nitric oxide synthase oxygenase [Paraliomyxa miuraensis]
MRTALIANRSHAAFDTIAAAVDAAGTFYGPPELAPGDRVVVLLGYDDVGSADARLASTELPPSTEVLLVRPDYGPRTPYAESCARAAHKVGATSILRHAPPTELLLRARAGVRTNGILSLPLRGAIPFVAWADVAQAVIGWTRSGGPRDISLHGPRRCDGPKLAEDLGRLLVETLDPHTFTLLRMREMDREGKGRIEVAKVVRFLTTMGTPREEAERVVRAADRDGDGAINASEFSAGLDELLEDTLASVPRKVSYLPLPPAMIRRQWAEAGVPYRRAAAESAHLLKTESVDSDPVWQGRLDPLDSLREHALSFVNLFILPGRGLLTMHETYFGDPDYQTLRWRPSDELLAKPATVSRLQTIDGGELHTRRTQDGSAVEARWALNGATEMIAFNRGDEQRTLELFDGRLIGLACRGQWEGMRGAMGDLFRQRRLHAWERALFRELGTLEPHQANEAGEPDEVVCSCAGVRRSTLLEVIEQGCRSLPQIVDRTGATAICGGCTPVVEEMLGSPKLHVAEVLALETLAQRFVRLRVVPVESPPVASRAGQHVVLQGRIEGRWVTRAYTLVSPGGQMGPYEVVVKREELGLFSGWLADQANRESLLRVSEPAGEYHLRDTDEGPIYMFAGGIGITPGIALARTLVADPRRRRLHIDWSARRPEDFVFARELEQLDERHDHISWTRRCTSQGGRLGRDVVARYYGYVPGAVAFVCGPERFLDEVRGHLRDARWPDEAVRVEVFSSNVNDEGEVLDLERKRGKAASEPVGDQTRVQHDSFFLDLSGRWPLLREAELALTQIYEETGRADELPARLEEVRKEVATTGTYRHTIEELTHGARLAWRNSSRCIGRFFWEGLQVRDMRHLQTEEQIFEAIVEHLRRATNGGDLLSVLTVFRPGPPIIRLYNSQLLRYAGYRQPDGSFIGDPANAELTEIAMELGWRGKGTRFDLLPIIIRIGDAPPKWFSLPHTPEVCLEVPIEHPTLPWFAELGLRWYAVPAVSEMSLDLGGVHYRAIPFNGFYMGTEIGARNFSDVDRYDMLPVIADRLGLDRSHASTLWRDRAQIELNVAVLHSYRKHGVRMQDHHSMGEYFLEFEKQETAAGREVFGDWSWLVPPIAGSASPLFFRDDLQNKVFKPMYGYQAKPWHEDEAAPDHEGPVPPCPLHAKRPRAPRVVSSPAFSKPSDVAPVVATPKPPRRSFTAELPATADELVAGETHELDPSEFIEEFEDLEATITVRPPSKKLERKGLVEQAERGARPQPPAGPVTQVAPAPAPGQGQGQGQGAPGPRADAGPGELDRTVVSKPQPTAQAAPAPVADTGDPNPDRTMVAPAPQPPESHEWDGSVPGVIPVRLVMLGWRGEPVAERRVEPWSFLDMGRQPGEHWPDDPDAVHARIFPAAGGVVVDDFGRPNGAHAKVTGTVAVQDGTEIKIGQARLVLGRATGVAHAWGQLAIFRHQSPTPEVVLLDRDVLTIGREQGDIVFPHDAFVSARHCRIMREGSTVYLEDLGSSNGTFVRVRPGQCVPFGGLLMVGNVQLMVLAG